ncbi:hypothetical protein ACWIID_23110 [Streptomyces phaeochromogenes]
MAELLLQFPASSGCPAPLTMFFGSGARFFAARSLRLRRRSAAACSAAWES